MTEEQTYIILATLTGQIQQSPDNATLYLKRAQTYLALNDTSHALDDLDKAISLDNTLAEAYMLRGQQRFKLHDRNAAFEDLKKAMSLNPRLMAYVSGEYKTKEPTKPFKI